MRVGMIGLGNMGSAIANLVASNGYEVVGWEYNTELAEEINSKRINSKYLSGIVLNRNLRATADIQEVLSQSDIVFVAIPSVFIKPTLQPFQKVVSDNSLIVNMAKGIDSESGLTAFQTLSALFPRNSIIMLSGPTIANEFAHKMPTVVVLAGHEHQDLLTVARLLDNDYFRTRFSNDTMGVELGGILKNIYTIGLGLFDGQHITSVNFRAAYLTIALEEIAKIGAALGADIETFLYLAGIGDLLATSLSEHSHNRQMGEFLAQGLSLEEIRQSMGVLPEGYNTLQIILYIAEKMHVPIPLAKGLWDVIRGHYDAEYFIESFIKDFVA